MSTHIASSEAFNPRTLHLTQVSMSEDDGLLLESTNHSAKKIAYISDLEPLYVDLCAIMQKYLNFDTFVKVLRPTRSANNFVGLAGECICLDEPDGVPYLWIGGEVPKYQLKDKKGVVQWQHRTDNPLQLVNIQNRFVFNFFIEVLEAHISKLTCAWYYRGNFQNERNYYYNMIDETNIIFDEAQLKYLQDAAIISSQVAKEKVDQEVRKRFLSFQPMTSVEMELRAASLQQEYLATAIGCLLQDSTTTSKMVELFDELVIYARAALPSFSELFRFLTSNSWGVFEYTLQSRVNRNNNLVINYQGDYRILQWEQEHGSQFSDSLNA